jgi:hypothetical protein
MQTLDKIITSSEFKAAAADVDQQSRHLAMHLIQELRVASYGVGGFNKVTATSESVQREVLDACHELLRANGWRAELKHREKRSSLEGKLYFERVAELALFAPES